MTLEKAKQILRDHLNHKNITLYIESDVDFKIIQRAHIEIIITTYTKRICSLFLLKNVGSYADIKEIIQEKLLHPIIQKITKLFKGHHFIPYGQLLIQNIIELIT